MTRIRTITYELFAPNPLELIAMGNSPTTVLQASFQSQSILLQMFSRSQKETKVSYFVAEKKVKMSISFIVLRALASIVEEKLHWM